MSIVTDLQIKEYLQEKKQLPRGFKPELKNKKKYNSFEAEALGDNGNSFKLIVRQSKTNALDFSVILGVMIDGSLFRLKRYNGTSHDHTNKIERTRFSGFHIHAATQRYQENGFQEDGFAEHTVRYSDWKSAMEQMVRENNFVMDVDRNQKRLV
ncbi:hypothetical protein HY772_04835 [Candidatus Woesearchaeota archaeon]|nr:hypothetical protein [Candidatus Woesearchaeota archaeon]